MSCGGLSGLFFTSLENSTHSALPRNSALSRSAIVPLEIVKLKSGKSKGVQDVFGLFKDSAEIKVHMKGFGKWDFDVIELDRLSQGNALYIVAVKGVAKLVVSFSSPRCCVVIVLRFSITRTLTPSPPIHPRLPQQGLGEKREEIQYNKMKAQRFFLAVQKSYLSADKVPYHNYMHGADVAASVYYFMRKKVSQNILSQTELFGGMIAALVHDVGHPGVNNKFLVASNNKLAIDYNDDSVLENMHCALCFRLSMREGHEVFDALKDPQYRATRLLIIKMVLDTDLANHFESLGQFKTRMAALDARLAESEQDDKSQLGSLMTTEDKFMILRM